MKYLVLILAICITGCTTVQIPKVPKYLTEECPKLELVKDNAQMSDVLATVTDNYAQYHDCSLKVKMWNDWYNKQRSLYEKTQN